MKIIKIIIAISIIAAIALVAMNWIGGTPPPPPIVEETPTVNTYVTRIQAEIASIRKAPASIISKEQYENTKYLIADFHQQNLLSSNANDGNQWKEILSRDVYTAYAGKFKEQAMYVFENSEWNVDDINTIRSELKQLRSSTYLEKDSPLAVSFKKIDTILDKYDEIASFIRKCKNYRFTDYSLQTAFPSPTDNIEQAKNYLKNKLENPYVNNCLRLKEGLQAIPIMLFDEHVRYLRTKISEHADNYPEYSTQAAYSTSVFTPLKNQLKALSNEVYELTEEDLFRREHEALERLLSSYNMRAANHFRSSIEN